MLLPLRIAPPAKHGSTNFPTSGAPRILIRSDKSNTAAEKNRRDEDVSKKNGENNPTSSNVTDYEEINVAVRPWVRLNGTLNRRVLDRLLGAVLSLVMERPGISGRDVVCRFSPALQPAHTHDLLDTLVYLQCIVKEELVPSHKPSLFSDTVDYILGHPASVGYGRCVERRKYYSKHRFIKFKLKSTTMMRICCTNPPWMLC
nr:uncharacterized protein LOC128704454 [Cherax quadricarinatus]